MRGSPLLRTLLILVVLVASGFLIVALTRNETVGVAERPLERRANQSYEIIEAKVYVTLSGGANRVMLSANAGHLEFGESLKARRYSSEMKIAKENPVMDVKVVWREKSAAPRFAKLVVEADGEKTFTHVFDSEGDIDDFVELPF